MRVLEIMDSGNYRQRIPDEKPIILYSDQVLNLGMILEMSRAK